MKNLGIYIHIPFCRKKCNYCDFFSLAENEKKIPSYVNRLLKEIKNFNNSDYIVDTIFFGGGTPSILKPTQICQILNEIYKNFKIESNIEITLETNPCTNNNFKDIFQAGINRISFGLQSTNDNELHRLGRLHTFNDFLQNYNAARTFFNNINIDLIYAIPDQTLKNWEHTLKKIKKLSPEHISAYSLTIENGTPFANMKLNLPNEDVEWKMGHLTSEIFFDYNHYEISNYAKKGFECKHNLKYWNMCEYVGFGAGAHSFLNGKRIENSKNLLKVQQTFTTSNFLTEYVITGLRKADGIEIIPEVMKAFGNLIEKYISNGMFTIENNRLRFTKRGMEISNYILSDFV